MVREAGVADAAADPGPLQEHDGGAVDQPGSGGLLLHPHYLARNFHPTALPQLATVRLYRFDNS